MRQIVLAVMIALLCICAAVVLTLNCETLYYLDMELLQIEEMSGFSEEVIRENYGRLIRYNLLWNREPLNLTLRMSEYGRIHFIEVKRIFDAIQVMLGLSAAGILGLGYSEMKKKNYGFLIKGGILSIVLPIITAGGIALNWERAFVIFHEIFFQNDYWIFDEYTDPIIKMLPDTYFMHCAVMIIVLILVFSTGCILVGKYLNSVQEKSQEKVDTQGMV